VRHAATYALGKIGDKRIVDGLVAALKDSDSSVRWAASDALREIGDARAVDGLVAALKDEDSRVRVNAVVALVKIGGERAVDGLVATLKDSDSSVRWAVADALGEIGGERAVDGLVAALKHQDSGVRWRATKGLKKIGDHRAVDRLVAALKDPNDEVRKGAAEALYELEKKKIITYPSYQPPKVSDILGRPVIVISSDDAFISRARFPLWGEDEEIAQKLAKLSKLCHIQFASNEAAYEETVAEFRRIGEQLCANGGDERMRLIACRVQALGGRSRDCENYWSGICGWLA
jgi:hypothetical protein